MNNRCEFCQNHMPNAAQRCESCGAVNPNLASQQTVAQSLNHSNDNRGVGIVAKSRQQTRRAMRINFVILPFAAIIFAIGIFVTGQTFGQDDDLGILISIFCNMGGFFGMLVPGVFLLEYGLRQSKAEAMMKSLGVDNKAIAAFEAQHAAGNSQTVSNTIVAGDWIFSSLRKNSINALFPLRQLTGSRLGSKGRLTLTFSNGKTIRLGFQHRYQAVAVQNVLKKSAPHAQHTSRFG